MSYVCEIVNTATQACDQWAVYSPLLPELTNEARDELLKYMISVFVLVFTVTKVKRLFGG